MLTLLLLIQWILCACADECTGQSAPNPTTCRLTSSSDIIYALTPENLRANSGKEILMRYDLKEDPIMKNTLNKWDGGWDIYHKTAYDYTRWDGPLGM